MATRDQHAAESVALDEPRVALERVVSHDLPDHLAEVVTEYETTLGDRDGFLWKWAHHLFPAFTLSCVPRDAIGPLRDHKLIGLMFVSVLDDVAEMHDDRATFEEAVKIPFEHQTPDFDRDQVDAEVLSFACHLWERFVGPLRTAPRYDEFENVFRFNLKQVLNAIDFSFVANQDIDLVNESDLQRYDAHNMMLYTFADIDIVHSPAFDRTELPTLRRVIGRAQRMVRIGNWVTTWQRELAESDVASGIVVYALEHDIITVDDLDALQASADEGAQASVIEAILDHDVEDVFHAQWEDELTVARERAAEVDSVDVDSYLDGIEMVMEYHLASRGLK